MYLKFTAAPTPLDFLKITRICTTFKLAFFKVRGAIARFVLYWLRHCLRGLFAAKETIIYYTYYDADIWRQLALNATACRRYSRCVTIDLIRFGLWHVVLLHEDFSWP